MQKKPHAARKAVSLLRFSPPNTKMRKTGEALNTEIRSFNLPAFRSRDGFTVCEGAGICASLCYARQGWYHRDVVADLREENLRVLRELNTQGMYHALEIALDTLPARVGIVRVHDSGDFFNLKYLTAWLRVMNNHPELRFYAYTKMVPFFVSEDQVVPLPRNFTLVFSEGGRWDEQIPEECARSRIFVTHEEREASGYVDGTGTDGDLPVLLGERRIGLVYHGSHNLKLGQERALRLWGENQDRKSAKGL